MSSENNTHDQSEQRPMITVSAETFMELQQRFASLEQLLHHQQQQQQQHATPGVTEPQPPATAMEVQDAFMPLHSLETRPSYTWTPSPLLAELLSLGSPLFTSPPLTDDERGRLIERYPTMEALIYQPPDTVPLAAKKMHRGQTKQDMSLKRLQYLLSGVVRPLDVLGLELSKDDQTEHVQRYLQMLADCRKLLLNVASQITEMRNTLAFQAINPQFQSPSSTSHNYTMSPDVFQTALAQQTASVQALQKAKLLGRSRRRPMGNAGNNNSAFQTGPPQQFFRPGPSSVQGGFNNNTGVNNPNNYANQFHSQPHKTHHSKNKVNTNPFRNSSQ